MTLTHNMTMIEKQNVLETKVMIPTVVSMDTVTMVVKSGIMEEEVGIGGATIIMEEEGDTTCKEDGEGAVEITFKEEEEGFNREGEEAIIFEGVAGDLVQGVEVDFESLSFGVILFS